MISRSLLAQGLITTSIQTEQGSRCPSPLHPSIRVIQQWIDGIGIITNNDVFSERVIVCCESASCYTLRAQFSPMLFYNWLSLYLDTMHYEKDGNFYI